MPGIRIQPHRIPDGGRDYEGDEPASLLGLSEEPTVRAEHPVRYRVHADVVTGELLVTGRVWTELELECVRCTEFFSTTVEESAFLRAYPVSEETESVDISEDIREAVLLQTPPYPHCREDCKGLCPQCGTNLNEGACDCRADPEDDRWGALDNLDL